MFRWFYAANAILSFLAFIYYFETTLTKVNQKQILLLIFIGFANVSYSLSTFALSVESALLLNIVYYICTTMILTLMMLVIVELCGYEVKRYIRLFLFGYSAIIIFLVSTTQCFGLYYKAAVIGKAIGATYLIKQYGALHFLLVLFILGVDFATMCVVVVTMCRKKTASYRVTTMLLVILIVSSFIYLLPRMIGIQLEFVPFSYTISSLVLISIFRRASLYDMSSNLLNAYEQRNEYGYICFNLKKQYMGCNSFALKIYPELKNLRIDSKVPESCERIHKELVHCIDEFKKNVHHEHIYHAGDISVICTITNIFSVKKRAGYLIELRDITAQQNYAEKLEAEVAVKTKKIVEIQDSIITGMASMVESRDNSTGGHIKRTSAGVRVFIEALKNSPEFSDLLSETFCHNMIKAAPMHDLGKIAVDDAILRKPGKFEPEEYEKMKEHSAKGAKIVEGVLINVDDEEFKKIAVNVAHYHHEKWNGTGYPAGLKEKEIPLEARIMAFADVFDALVSRRCYKEAFTYDRAFEIIKNDAGTHFDPELAPVFLASRPQLEELYRTLDE